ncbi:HNH endonuclease signature motif containing protein, partial [Caballeronia terrestris]|uniref:HNH endonuclease signature motif containing protein n=1 Tax=Caballeronia terrestris TaxID=1226301 RepID=UPI0011776C4A
SACSTPFPETRFTPKSCPEKSEAVHCERAGCGQGQRYRGFLDVHHILGAEKGDRVWNCVALCPNCHRDAHYSAEAQVLNLQLLEYAKQFEPSHHKA